MTQIIIHNGLHIGKFNEHNCCHALDFEPFYTIKIFFPSLTFIRGFKFELASNCRHHLHVIIRRTNIKIITKRFRLVEDV
jgi:hypothetical protein